MKEMFNFKKQLNMTQAQIQQMATIGMAVVKAVATKDTKEAENLKRGIEKIMTSSDSAEKTMLGIYLRRLNTLCPN